jgi:hypothetical protein
MEWEAEEKAKTAGLAVNHVMKYQNSIQFRALPPPYHPHQPFQPLAPLQTFQLPQTCAHAYAAIFGICSFVAEPTHSSPNGLQPATTPDTATTKARGT